MVPLVSEVCRIKFPFSSVIVVILDPFKETAAPLIGLLALSVIVPVMVLLCASKDELIQLIKRIAIKDDK